MYPAHLDPRPRLSYQVRSSKLAARCIHPRPSMGPWISNVKALLANPTQIGSARRLPRCEILEVQVQADGPWRRGLAGLAMDAITLLIHLAAVAMDEQGGSQRQLGMLGQEVPGPHQTATNPALWTVSHVSQKQKPPQNMAKRPMRAVIVLSILEIAPRWVVRHAEEHRTDWDRPWNWGLREAGPNVLSHVLGGRACGFWGARIHRMVQAPKLPL